MIEIGDKVKQKYTLADRVGTVIGIWEEDEYFSSPEGKIILFACKGEYKVQFYNDMNDSYATFSEQELLKL